MPDTLIVDGHAFSWQRLCELRQQQLEARKYFIQFVVGASCQAFCVE
jgi:hypothetical protein